MEALASLSRRLHLLSDSYSSKSEVDLSSFGQISDFGKGDSIRKKIFLPRRLNGNLTNERCVSTL